MAVMVTKVGATVASKSPRKNRAVMSVLKLCAVVMRLRVIPCTSNV